VNSIDRQPETGTDDLPADVQPADADRGMNVFFRLTVVATSVFVVTILASLSTLFGDPLSPVNVFLEQRATGILVFEVAVILTLALLALSVDRRRTLKQQATATQPTPTPAPDVVTDSPAPGAQSQE